MRRRMRRFFAFILTLAMIVTSVTWPDVSGSVASAAETPSEQDYKVSSILSASGATLVSTQTSSSHVDDDGTSYFGYIQSLSVPADTAAYYKVVFTVAEGTADTTDIVTFQPYDSGWKGWNQNIITLADAEYDSTTGQYVAYMSVNQVVDSLNTGNDLAGINVSFCQSEPTVTLDGLYVLNEPDPADEVVLSTPATLQAITGQDIVDAGIESTKFVGSSTVKVYIKVTKCTPYSAIKLSCGTTGNASYPTGGYSNKILKGLKCSSSITDSGYVLHGRTGDGKGAAFTGYYVFPDSKLNKASAAEDAIIWVRALTSDVEAHIVGVVCSGGASFSVAEDGTITSGFSASSLTLESTAEDSSDTSTEEQLAAAEAERQSAKSSLKNSIDACTALLTSGKYQDSSITKLETAIATAQSVYDDDSASKATYRSARDTLGLVRTAMIFKDSEDTGNPKSFRTLKKTAIISDMGAGINLGNTFDGGLINATETGWQAYKTTKEYIKALHDAGYNTVRIPVTWNGYINDDYSIDEEWISRVQEVVDYCIDQDMYCIINIHHDGAANHDTRGKNSMCWLNTASDDIDSVYDEFEGVWRTIANRFKDYDDHLIFESMNEVTDSHDGTVDNEDTDVLNCLNQLFVNTVRATGSNNTKRWLAFTGRFATFSTGLTLPKDSYNSDMRLMCAVHIYKDNSSTRWTYDQLKNWQSSLSSTVKNVKALSSDIPIYVGEYGVKQQVQSGSSTGYNNTERALNSEFVNAVCKYYDVAPVVWDQGDGDYSTTETNTGLFNYWNRPSLKPVYADTIEGMMRGSYVDSNSDLATLISGIYTSYGHSSTSNNSVSKDPTITEVTDIETDDTVVLKAGERKTLTATVSPEGTNDVVLWSTDNDAVATVFNGNIRAKGAGVTTVHVYSQSGSVSKDIKVMVTPDASSNATAITTSKSYYEIEQGDTADIVSALTPSNSNDDVTYMSTNTDIATVSSSGKITAVAAGSAYIVVTAASGVSTIVKVVVPENENSSKVNVALNIYMNSGAEAGKPVTITEDGQYTVTYDLASDASSSDVSLSDIVSVYIKDCNASNPTVEEAQIRYDAVSVNGVALGIKSSEFKSAVKTNGQFDTNDPINGWDGSAVNGVTTSSSHTVTFDGISTPTKISVTFTIAGLKFKGVEKKTNEATSMEVSGDNKIRMSEVGTSAAISAVLAPITTDSYVSFYSTDSSVVSVDSTAVATDAEGKASVTLNAMGEGTAIVTGITENGLKVFYSVTVGDGELVEPYDPTPENLNSAGDTATGDEGTDNGTGDSDTGSGSTNNDQTQTTPSASPTVNPLEPTIVPTATPILPVVTATPDTDVDTDTDDTDTDDIDDTEVGEDSDSVEEQTIIVDESITKVAGCKAFNLDAETDGDGILTYVSSNKKVATVNTKGKVTVKACGITYITISASATADYGAATAKCKLIVKPAKVNIKKAKNISDKKIQITWKKDSTITGYQITYSSDKKFSKSVKNIAVNKSKVSYVIKNQKKGQNYYVKIRSYVKSGNTNIYSAYSNVKCVKVKK